MPYIQLITALLPILEKLIVAVEAAAHLGGPVTVPAKAAELRRMMSQLNAMASEMAAAAPDAPKPAVAVKRERSRSQNQSE